MIFVKDIQISDDPESVIDTNLYLHDFNCHPELWAFFLNTSIEKRITDWDENYLTSSLST